MKNQNSVMKWVNIVSFGLLLLGGLNFLLMGLFNFDLFAAVFGGRDAMISRVFYTLVGLSALMLLGSILWKAMMSSEPAVNTSARSKSKTA